MKKSMVNMIRLFIGMCVLMLLCSCASTAKSKDVTKSGFLENYGQLKAGTEDEAQLIYIDPTVNFKSYTKILMDPIKMYSSEKDSNLKKLSKEEQQSLLNYLDATLRENLKKDYTFVDAPGPDVMRLRVAITDAEDSNVTMDTISSILPIGMALNVIKVGITGKSSFVGEAGIEAEILDSQTGKRLAAGVDRRVGSKYTGKFDKFNEWHAVTDSYDFWAQRLQARLAELRQGKK
jgi:uncharacterized membrane protein